MDADAQGDYSSPMLALFGCSCFSLFAILDFTGTPFDYSSISGNDFSLMRMFFLLALGAFLFSVTWNGVGRSLELLKNRKVFFILTFALAVPYYLFGVFSYGLFGGTPFYLVFGVISFLLLGVDCGICFLPLSIIWTFHTNRKVGSDAHRQYLIIFFIIVFAVFIAGLISIFVAAFDAAGTFCYLFSICAFAISSAINFTCCWQMNNLSILSESAPIRHFSDLGTEEDISSVLIPLSLGFCGYLSFANVLFLPESFF